MPLILKGSNPAVSNKPPLLSPDPEMFLTPTVFKSGRTIWRTYPQPDKVRIVGYLRPEHFHFHGSSVMAPSFLEKRVTKLFLGLKSKSKALGPTAFLNFNLKGFFKGDLRIGPRLSNVHVEGTKVSKSDTPTPGYRLTLDFNPRKLSSDGCKQLHEVLVEAANGSFDFGQFLRDAKITQMDVAIDFADVLPAELIVTAAGEGKRVHYRGQDGALESVYVHRAFALPSSPVKTPKRLGRLIAVLYDRNRERAVWGKPPPYETRQITRLEVTLSNQKLKLVDLGALKNPFLPVKLSLAKAVAFSDRKLWDRYCAAVLGVGPTAAGKLIHTQPAIAVFLRKAWEGHPSNLLAPDAWNGWQKGVVATGLGYLIATAQNQPANGIAPT